MTSIVLPPDYKPSADEEYMNEMQLEYFRQKLENWKKSIVSQSVDTLEDLRQGGLSQPDEIDRASLETDKALDLRTKDRIRKLITKIDEALDRIEDGTYVYLAKIWKEIRKKETGKKQRKLFPFMNLLFAYFLLFCNFFACFI